MKRSRLLAIALGLFIGLITIGRMGSSPAQLPPEVADPIVAETWVTAQGTTPLLTAACQSKQDPTLHRRVSSPTEASIALKQLSADYTPRQQIVPAHATNFGDRFARDVKGRPVSNDPVVVLHETVGSASSVINLFQTPHPRDEDQVSYHALITRRGAILYFVPPDRRAYGAGNSVFRSAQGNEAVQTNPRFPASVNNFAYHISLETPADGMHNGRGHSGYTEAQYQSLSWLVAKTGVPDARITTHRAVDRSGSRRDPRSFNFQKFNKLLNTYPREDELGLFCAMQPAEPASDLHAMPTPETTGNAIGQ